MQETADSIPESGRSPGGGHGNPLHYSCLENPMDRGVQQVHTVYGVTTTQTRLKQLSMHSWSPNYSRGCLTLCDTFKFLYSIFRDTRNFIIPHLIWNCLVYVILTVIANKICVPITEITSTKLHPQLHCSALIFQSIVSSFSVSLELHLSHFPHIVSHCNCFLALELSGVVAGVRGNTQNDKCGNSPLCHPVICSRIITSEICRQVKSIQTSKTHSLVKQRLKTK